jgi:DNA replication initiation complex subunit (GINS family)
MYDELYAAWRLEVENNELSSLPADFYARLANYMQNLKEETQPQSEKTVRSTLLHHEKANAHRMTQELIATRYRKLLKLIVASKKVPTEYLTTEEQSLYTNLLPPTDVYGKFAKNLLDGHLTPITAVEQAAVLAPVEPTVEPSRVLVRFLKPVPSIMGSDMKSYGPFLVEDVASVPAENAKILVKQGLARMVEPS